MTTEILTFRGGVLLSASRAILDKVTPGLRCVLIRPEYPEIAARFVYEHEPTDEEREDVSVAETEVIADFPSEVRVSFVAICVPMPTRVPGLPGEIALYARKEATNSEGE